MTIDTKQFWALLSASDLLPQSQIQELSNKFFEVEKDPTATIAAQWLVAQSVLFPYQAVLLLAGLTGPFHYGNYTLVDRFDKGELAHFFKGMHRSSSHPVLIEFFPGKNAEDLERWRQVETRSQTGIRIVSPHVLRPYETVILPQHRMVVSQLPVGIPMDRRLPRKARLPWQDACVPMSQIARGLAAIHEAGLVHGEVSPRTVWLQKSGLAQLRLTQQTDHEFNAPPSNPKLESRFDYLAPEGGDAPTVSGDIYALGCTLVRAITGRTPFAAKRVEEIIENHRSAPVPDLSKYEVPGGVVELIHQLLAKAPNDRPDDLLQVSERLMDWSGKRSAIEAYRPLPSPTYSAYQSALHQFQPGSRPLPEAVPALAVATENETEEAPTTPESRAEKIAAATAQVQRRRSGWLIPVLASCILAAVVGGLGYWASHRPSPITALGDAGADDTGAVGSGADDTGSVGTGAKPASTDTTTPPTGSTVAVDPSVPEAERPVVFQRLIEDDQTTLWETPTTGPPVDFSGIPAAPKLMFVFRPAEIVASSEGKRVIKSLGPSFQSIIDHWKQQSGLELDDVAQLIVSLHSTPEFRYQAYSVVRLRQPVQREQLIQLWNRPSERQTKEGQSFFVSPDQEVAYYVLGSHDSEKGTMITRFACGPVALVEEVARTARGTPLTGPMWKMARWTDRDRHFTLLYLRSALFNDEGQALMGDSLSAVNRELAWLLPDDLRGGLVSLHLDEGTYWELMFDRALGLKPNVLKETLVKRLREERKQLTNFVIQIPSNPYWDRVRLVYDNMLTDFWRHLRWDVEHGEVVANCWLPPMAAHNLFGASELVMTFASGAGAVSQTVKNAPQTIEEVLALKRDLVMVNPPDLNLLMADIESEINEEVKGLPFKFHIRLMGNDLEKEGITQNQRPEAIDLKQKPLGEILTAIMTGANPAKDITGPSDPNCKLLWVVADDPKQPGKKAVLITTRAAAKKKGYRLPEVFRVKE